MKNSSEFRVPSSDSKKINARSAWNGEPGTRNFSFKEALAELEARQESKIKPGLSRMRRHLRALGNPETDLKVIHVAGTNGKGSICAILESVLRAQSYKTGFYLSPHLFSARERVRINGRWISEKQFAFYLSRAINADKKKELSYFELMTSIAFQCFAEEKVDVAVLETGLGGRFDATNVVERPLACVISSIDFDHTAWLGKTLASIAFEKAGIIKAGRPVICPKLPRPALRVIAAKARALKAPLIVVRQPLRPIKTDWTENSQQLEDRDGLILTLGLMGSRQPLNAAVCEVTLDAIKGDLPVSTSAWRRGLASVSWPGRFQVLKLRGRTAVIDGAHNPEAGRALAKTWASSPWAKRPALWIIGVMKDKDVRGVLKPLAPYLREVVTVAPPSPRALDAVTLAREVRRAAPSARVTAEHDWRTAIKAWLVGMLPSGHPPVHTAVVCGSFYLAGKALMALGVEQ